MKILCTEDRLKITIEDVTFIVAPLTYKARQEMESCSTMQEGTDLVQLSRYNKVAIKHGLKEIKGFIKMDDKPYELRFNDDSDTLTDECIAELMGVQACHKMAGIIYQLMSQDISLEDVVTGKKMDDMTIEYQGISVKKS